MSYERYFLKQNVHDAALDRIRWVFSEFETVYVSFSGGTVVLGLSLQVAEELGRLPDVNDHFYWTMGWPIGSLDWGWPRLNAAGTILINRKPLATKANGTPGTS